MSKQAAPSASLLCVDVVQHACDFAEQLDAILTCLSLLEGLPPRGAGLVSAGLSLVEHYAVIFEGFSREASGGPPA
ncbi:hypothetical protein BUE93_21505 [Chromobacterium amazonense]|uniref:Uncharacterized protein n=1 Tax=Chromobacterium amazonense TaxID=1382803 RepID=A0A2S9WYS7_9NEIS|nr:hypothetical protein [Chromobacterium amazonense]PRP68618.1 hypothetical protein BUE93_21505 [Chromobacterium amazonense]